MLEVKLQRLLQFFKSVEQCVNMCIFYRYRLGLQDFVKNHDAIIVDNFVICNTINKWYSVYTCLAMKKNAQIYDNFLSSNHHITYI